MCVHVCVCVCCSLFQLSAVEEASCHMFMLPDNVSLWRDLDSEEVRPANNHMRNVEADLPRPANTA